jgi:acyl carrier protein
MITTLSSPESAGKFVAEQVDMTAYARQKERHMSNPLTEHQIVEIQEILMRQLEVTREQMTDDASIIRDLGADSLDVVEIGMNLEECFNITIPDERWETVNTVGDMYEAVAKLLTVAIRPD